VLFIIYYTEASRTLSSLPLSGYTPYLSLPITSMAAITRDLALSPSVSMRVHYSEYFRPASFASSSFSMPNSLAVLTPFIFLFIFVFYLALAYDTMASSISVLRRALENFSVTLKRSLVSPPKSLTFVVIFSLV